MQIIGQTKRKGIYIFISFVFPHGCCMNYTYILLLLSANQLTKLTLYIFSFGWTRLTTEKTINVICYQSIAGQNGVHINGIVSAKDDQINSLMWLIEIKDLEFRKLSVEVRIPYR